MRVPLVVNKKPKKFDEFSTKTGNPIVFSELTDYAALRLFSQLRMPATIEPTIKNVAIAYEPVLTAGIVAA